MTKKEEYQGWIDTLAMYQGGRPNYKDQTVESLMVLEKLVGMIEPTMIVELGTAHGLSTRLWLRVTSGIPIHCVDAGFEPLRGSSAVLPVDFSRLILHQKWVHDVQLESLWTQGDKVLLYVDIHSDHQHVLDAVPKLPNGSVVVFDDVWRSGKDLKGKEEIDQFVEEVVVPQIDHTAPKAIWPRHYASYWKRGGFYGFAEVPVICHWTSYQKVRLHWEKGAKLVWFSWPGDKE